MFYINSLWIILAIWASGSLASIALFEDYWLISTLNG